MLPFVLALSASRDLPSPPARFRGYSVHIFRMVLPFETASAEDRRVERERQRRLVFALLRSDPTADCLAAMATNLLDHQFRLEDAVLVAAADAPPPADRLRRLLSLSLDLPQARLNLTILFYLFYILFVFALPVAGSAVFALPVAGSAVLHSRLRALLYNHTLFLFPSSRNTRLVTYF